MRQYRLRKSNGLPPVNVSEDSGSAALEFVVIMSLFLTTVIAAVQGLTSAEVSASRVQSIADSLARDYSLHQSAERLDLLSKKFEAAGTVSFNLDCAEACQPGSAFEVTVRSGSTAARATEVIDDTGSVMPLALGLAAVLLSLLMLSTNLAETNLHQQRANSVARAVAMAAATHPIDSTLFAHRTAAQIAPSATVTMVEVSLVDRLTTKARVCLRFSQARHVCASSLVRGMPVG